MKIILFVFVLLITFTAQADIEDQEGMEDYPQEEVPQEEPLENEDYPNEMSDEPAEE